MIRILHVDDEKSDHELTALNLNKLTEDFQLERAETGQQAIEMLASDNYDCILCDYQMPGMDGLELLRNLRLKGNYSPFIFLTGQGSEQIAAEALRAGADDYFTKSIGFAYYDRLINSVRRIVEAKEHRDERRKVEDKYRQLFENDIAGVYRTSIDGRLLECNPAFLDILGFNSFEELEQINVINTYIRPEDRKKLISLLKKDGMVTNLEFQLRKKDETRIWVLINAVLLSEYTIQGTLIDITERKLAEQARKESEEKYRRIIQSSPMGMHLYELESDGKIVFIGANPAADKILGIDNSQFIGKTIEEAFPPLANTEVPDRYRNAARNGTSWITEQIIYEDQRIKGVFEVHAFQTSPGKMAAFFLDITARKKAEEEARKSASEIKVLYSLGQKINADLTLVI